MYSQNIQIYRQYIYINYIVNIYNAMKKVEKHLKARWWESIAPVTIATARFFFLN